ncbi:MAG: homocysteine biosynthesis protein, partial [Waterburya sp.]
MRTIAQINEKISRSQAVVWTVAEVKAKIARLGSEKIFEQVDVITTGTFEPMESTGAIINLGHTDPPIKIRQCWLDGIAA